MKKVKSFEHACEVLEKDALVLPDVSAYDAEDRDAQIALFKLTTIIKAQNKLNGWKANWRQGEQNYKYWPWLWVVEKKKSVKNPSGLGLSCDGCVGTCSRAAAGSRLCVGTEDEAEYIGKEFISLYEAWFLN